MRPDGSTFHVVGYDQATGSVTSRGTAQGYSDTSTWARGQAWAVHGFAMTYRYTRDPEFLDVARSAADYWVSHLPADQQRAAGPRSPRTRRDVDGAASDDVGLVAIRRPDERRGRGRSRDRSRLGWSTPTASR